MNERVDSGRVLDAISAVKAVAAAPKALLVRREDNDAHEAALHGLIGKIEKRLPAIAVEQNVEAVLAGIGGRCGATRDSRGGGEERGWSTDFVADGKTTMRY